MMYSSYSKNHGKDLIYYNRLKLWGGKEIKSPIMYAYIMKAYLGIILT